MNEREKIEKIRKSCKVGKTVSTIITIIFIVGCVLTFCSGIAIFTMRDSVESSLSQSEATSKISASLGKGYGSFFVLDLSELEEIHSSIPEVDAMVKKTPKSIVFSIEMVFIALGLGILAFLTGLLRSLFELIIKEDNPFTDKVIQRVNVVMIISAVLAFLILGLGFGALFGVLAWVINTIMDYGKCLQVQADETL